MKCEISIVCLTFLIGSTNAILKPRIIGGEDADITNFPYQVSIRLLGQHYCGGVIISSRHILTAAHCFNSNIDARIFEPYSDVTIHTGTSISSEIGHMHIISKVTAHPQSAMKPISVNDIAVVTLADHINFDDTQRKVNLPSSEVDSGTQGFATGWGLLQEKGQIATRLQQLKMTIIRYVDCQPQIMMRIQENEMCAIHSKGHGTCDGDSGGPLVVDKQVVGILSWIQNGECANGIPEVYTNVYAHKKFIQATMKAHP